MNSTIYIFGKLTNGYTQYPEDYSKSIFTKFHEYAKATTQIAIHRTSNMMYYGYIRKLEDDQYIGLCVLLNDVYITKLDSLFSLFENTVSNMVAKGLLVNYNAHGDIVTNASKLYLNKEEIELISNALKAGFTNLEQYSQKLPALNYGLNKDSLHESCIEDDVKDIIKSTYTNGFTYIYKSSGYDTAQMKSYRGVLQQVSNEKLALQEEIDKLKIEKENLKNYKGELQQVSNEKLALQKEIDKLNKENENLQKTANKTNRSNENEDKNKKILIKIIIGLAASILLVSLLLMKGSNVKEEKHSNANETTTNYEETNNFRVSRHFLNSLNETTNNDEDTYNSSSSNLQENEIAEPINEYEETQDYSQFYPDDYENFEGD